jgi:hypothetical protein
MRLPQLPKSRCICLPPTLICMACALICLVVTIVTWADVAVVKAHDKSLTEENVIIRAELNAIKVARGE